MTLVTSGSGRTLDLASVPPGTVPPTALVGSALGLQNTGQLLEVRDPHRIAAFDGRLGHAENHTCLLALRHGESAGGPDLSQAGRPVFSHAGHQQAHGL